MANGGWRTEKLHRQDAKLAKKSYYTNRLAPQCQAIFVH
jgi:hypothetical protein